MEVGLIIGALISLCIARLGRLSHGRLIVAIVLGSVSCAAILQLPGRFQLPPPSHPVAEGLMYGVQYLIDWQWMAWWMIGGSLLPICFTFLLGLTRSLSPAVIGVCSGLGLGLLALCWTNYSPIPSMTGSLWRAGLGLQGVLYLACAMTTAGVQRTRSDREG